MNDAPRVTVTARVAPDKGREHPWLFASAAGLWCLAVGGAVQIVAWGGHFFRGALLHVGLVASIALLCTRPLVDRAAVRLLGVRGPVVAWRAFAAGALALAAYDAHAVDDALRSSWSFFSWFGRFWELEPEVFIVPIAVSLAAVVLTRRPVVARRWLRAQAWASLTIALALLGASVARAQRSPAIDAYIPSLALRGEIPAATDLGRWNPARADEPTRTFTDYALAGGVVVRRFAFTNRGQCALRLAARVDRLPLALAPRTEDFDDCGARELRHDPRAGLYVLTREDRWGGRTVTAFRGDSPAPVVEGGARMATYHAGFTLPRSWLWGSAAALALALASLVRAARARRSLGDLTAWRQATLRADGMLALDGDGALFPCPYGAQLAPGPVVLRAVPAGSGASPFRGGGATPERDDLAQGTVADLVAVCEADVEASHAHAITAALLAAAPLAAGALERLLF
jgi:hypothetical protein